MALTEWEKTVLDLKEGGATLEDIANELCITRERVKQLVLKAMVKIEWGKRPQERAFTALNGIIETFEKGEYEPTKSDFKKGKFIDVFESDFKTLCKELDRLKSYDSWLEALEIGIRKYMPSTMVELAADILSTFNKENINDIVNALSQIADFLSLLECNRYETY